MGIAFRGIREDYLDELESDPETRDTAHAIRLANAREEAAYSTAPAPPPPAALRDRIERELERRARVDSQTWTEFERALFAWYEATK